MDKKKEWSNNLATNSAKLSQYFIQILNYKKVIHPEKQGITTNALPANLKQRGLLYSQPGWLTIVYFCPSHSAV